LTWRWTGARLCVWNQRDLGVGSEGIGPRSQRAAVRRVRLVIANSQAGAEYLIRELGVPEGRIRVIRNGIELDPRAAGRDAWRRSLGVEAGCFLAVMVANLQPAKDHVTLLRAWRILLDRLPAGRREAVLLLAGYSGPTADRIKALAFDLDLGRRVRFLGPVKDVAGLLGAADLGVLSSRSEGCPNGVLECMAAGLPVVGTDIPGIREALGPDAARLLAPAGDAEGLAQRIQLFAGDPGLRAQAGEANRRRAQAEFSLQRMCEETTALLWEALVP
jgi:glycosyltransferase involved in cell wall biosynthesis